MSLHQVIYYQAQCDGCLYIETNYDDVAALRDPTDVFAVLEHWTTLGSRDLCPKCSSCEACDNPAADLIDGHLVCRTHENYRFPPAAAPAVQVFELNLITPNGASDV